jgi:hypothetical protein
MQAWQVHVEELKQLQQKGREGGWLINHTEVRWCATVSATTACGRLWVILQLVITVQNLSNSSIFACVSWSCCFVPPRQGCEGLQQSFLVSNCIT